QTAYYDTSWVFLTAGRYLYGIQAVYSSTSISETSFSNFVVMPGKTSIMSIAPNPFRQTASIHFMLQRNNSAKFEIFNVKGQHIRTLRPTGTQIGENTVTWDGKDDQGMNVPSGVYICRMKAGNQTDTRKMIFTK
ncbi:MAG TPA: FlgD immunoglobulin-like domain containing protein, partial [Candidatus Cloacimonadota bacterium]|nr:FlgD immunoglobulin-like domain containing protein [Candidatus Cloacimonadota bacterium]